MSFMYAVLVAKALITKTASDGGTGTLDHSKLINRSSVDQHPMSAITGLLDAFSKPRHNTMVVRAYTEGIGYKADYKASEIKRQYDGDGLVLLNFNAPDGTGEQSYRYESYVDFKDGKGHKAVFRRVVIDEKNFKVKRIIITIDENYNVEKSEQELDIPDVQILQHLEDDKADYILKVIASDRVVQQDAREVLAAYDQYDGKLIEFLTNGDNPSKCVATGRLMTTTSGDTYLITYNIDGTTTVWSRDSYEKHNFECRSFINEAMVDLDNFTIDIQGDAPYMASVRDAINSPPNTSEFGVITVIAYSVDHQTQLYRDIASGMEYVRTVTGTADRHSFSTWQPTAAMIADEETSANKTWSSQKISAELDKLAQQIATLSNK